MPTPNSTVVTTVTMVNNSGIGVTNLSTVNVVVTFPDASTANYALGNQVAYISGGQYTLTYNTKGAGSTIEEWSVFTTSSTPQAQFRHVYAVQEGTS